MTWLTPEIIIGAVLAAIAVVAAIPHVAKTLAAVQKTKVDIRFVEVQIRKVEAESAALNDAEQTRINAQTFTDLRSDVATLRNEIIALRNEVIALNRSNQDKDLENTRFKSSLDEAVRLLRERNLEIADLKAILEDVRKQLVDFMTKALALGIQPSIKDEQLLKNTKSDIADAAVEKAADDPTP